MTITTTSGLTLETMAASYRRALEAEGKSPYTLTNYLGAIRKLDAFLKANGMPRDIENIRREHLETFISDLHRKHKSNTVCGAFQVLHRFFNWLVDEDEIPVSPMAKMKRPKLEEAIIPTIPVDDLRRMLKPILKGKRFEDRRDLALLLVMYDCGLRLGEVASIALDDLDLDAGIITIRKTKTHRDRRVGIGKQTRRHLDRYLRMRSQHPFADLPNLWLGQRGTVGGTAIRDLVYRRAAAVGLKVYPHMFRHSFAARLAGAGMNDRNIMALAGWRSRTMLNRYGQYEAAEQALAAFDQVSPVDNLKL